MAHKNEIHENVCKHLTKLATATADTIFLMKLIVYFYMAGCGNILCILTHLLMASTVC